MKKDVTNDEMLRGDVSNLWSGDIRMGKPTSGNALVSHNEYIVIVESNPVNWNILVTGGKERKIDSLSSGERKGK